jgi:hypothetical protein
MGLKCSKTNTKTNVCDSYSLDYADYNPECDNDYNNNYTDGVIVNKHKNKIAIEELDKLKNILDTYYKPKCSAYFYFENLYRWHKNIDEYKAKLLDVNLRLPYHMPFSRIVYKNHSIYTTIDLTFKYDYNIPDWNFVIKTNQEGWANNITESIIPSGMDYLFGGPDMFIKAIEILSLIKHNENKNNELDSEKSTYKEVINNYEAMNSLKPLAKILESTYYEKYVPKKLYDDEIKNIDDS